MKILTQKTTQKNPNIKKSLNQKSQSISTSKTQLYNLAVTSKRLPKTLNKAARNGEFAPKEHPASVFASRHRTVNFRADSTPFPRIFLLLRNGQFEEEKDARGLLKAFSHCC
jgi:hypothetical protein